MPSSGSQIGRADDQQPVVHDRELAMQVDGRELPFVRAADRMEHAQAAEGVGAAHTVQAECPAAIHQGGLDETFAPLGTDDDHLRPV